MTVLILLLLIPKIKELIHSFVLVGFCISVYKSDIYDGASMSFLLSLYENVTSCIQSAPPLT